MGNRSINAIPMSFSLCASYMTAVVITGKYHKRTYMFFVFQLIDTNCYVKPFFNSNYISIGVPGEIAYHGWIFPITWLLSVSEAALVAGNLFIPIFYKMKLVSVYEVCTLTLVIIIDLREITAFCQFS